MARRCYGLAEGCLAAIPRSEATKQSSFRSAKEKLDCFAALAMTTTPILAGSLSRFI
jgi:hypothetical protein